MKASKTVFVCRECGKTSPKWLGKCPDCESWNSFDEEEIRENPKNSAINRGRNNIRNKAERFSELELPNYMRTKTGMGELDRVLGGGLVDSSVVLLSGEPGIGKSTLLLQICSELAKTRKVLYVSGEESKGQLKLRAERLGIIGDTIYLLTETDIDAVLDECAELKPDVIIIDSIQTLSTMRLSSVPGSITQVREGAMSLINYGKTNGSAVFLVGHVNKEGGIAGPKVLEHMVDAVLCFEGDRRQSYRIIRANKNRYGSTNEIGVFEMTDEGLREVANPSEMLLADRPTDSSGNCAVCTIEGTRPMVAEIQALVTPTVFPAPRRTSNGIDYNRTCLILAVLEKRLGLKFSSNDVYLNVIGGLRLDEPATDIAVALAMISSITDIIIPDTLIAMGELGLSGECRGISNLEHRVKEAARLGFTEAVIPYRNAEKLPAGLPIKIIPIKNVCDLVRVLKPANKRNDG